MTIDITPGLQKSLVELPGGERDVYRVEVAQAVAIAASPRRSNNITRTTLQVIGGEDLKLEEVNLIGETVARNMSPDALVMWGARILPEFKGKLQVITIITGVKSPYIVGKVDEVREARKTTNDLGIELLL